MQEELLKLNVGGTYFPVVSKKILTSIPETALEAMFSGRHELTKIDDRIFVNRDPDNFKNLIKFLRNDCKKIELESLEVKKEFLSELEFWGLKNPRSCMEDKMIKLFSQDYQINFDRGCSEELQKKWREIGPIDITKWIDEEIVSLDESRGI